MIHDLIGHISFWISAVSFMMKNILWLRIFAIISLLLSLYYNYFLPTWPLWVVLFWLCIFLLINFYQSWKLILENIEVFLSENEKILQTKAFPLLKSRFFKWILKKGEFVNYKKWSKIISKEDKLNNLYLLTKGFLIEKENDYTYQILWPWTFLGEATFILKEDYGGSPSDIFANSDVELFSINHKELQSYLDNNPNSKPWFLDGIVRNMIKKKKFLKINDFEEGNSQEISLTEEERKLHAFWLSSLNTKELKTLYNISQSESFKEKDKIIDSSNKVWIIVSWEVIVKREDNQFIKLNSWNFLWEVKWIWTSDYKVKNDIYTNSSSVKILWWDYESLNSLKEYNPKVFSSFVLHIAKNMGIKLTQPLTDWNTYDFTKTI